MAGFLSRDCALPHGASLDLSRRVVLSRGFRPSFAKAAEGILLRAEDCADPARLGERSRMAEREGFEPPIPLRVCRISSAEHSTTLPPLREVMVSRCRRGALDNGCL